MPGLAGDFYERGKKLESLAELMPIDSLRNYILIVSHYPAYFVSIAVTPQDSADRPNVGLRPAMRAGANRRATIQRKGNYVVGRCGHTAD